MLYIGAFVVVQVPHIYYTYFPVTNSAYVAIFFIPLQGALNALIYSDFFRIASVAKSIAKSVRSLRYMPSVRRIKQPLPPSPRAFREGGCRIRH